MANILVTGGAGYIGSHTVVKLLEENHNIVVIDNLSNSSAEVLGRILKISGKKFDFYQKDIRNIDTLNKIFCRYSFDAVIHFAGLKSVGQSVEKPLLYYDNNVLGSLNLIQCMQEHGVKKLVFSSSATVYGDPQELPLREETALGVPSNPYGASKIIVENILSDLYKSDNDWGIVNLRYFNPVGAHPSGLLGEDPMGVPSNIMPLICQTAIGTHKIFSVYGNDYDTPDGTGIRDYLHVLDLAEGHALALDSCLNKSSIQTFNLGTGKGFSVLEILREFERASGKKINYEIKDRRVGDVAACYADPSKAENDLGWKAKFDLQSMCKDSWNWQSLNPNGYVDKSV